MAFDLVVIGGGPGGYVAAIRAAQLGMHVALVEARELGGTCLNRGCIPTKALLHAANLYDDIRGAADMGVGNGEAALDLGMVSAHKAAVVQKQRDGIAGLLKANGVEVFTGQGFVAAPGRAICRTPAGQQTLEATRILLATGARPAVLPVPGAGLPGVLTSDDLLEGALPAMRSVTIVGGGVIGVEFATMLAKLGCQVTILEAAPRLLPTMDKRISQTLGMVFRKSGIAVVTSALLQGIEQDGDGLVCRYTHKDAEKTVCAAHVLMAVGRKPELSGLFAEDMQPALGRNGIVVDESFATSIPGVYAIGDVVDGSPQLAHVASAQGSNAVQAMAGKDPEIDLSVIPSCVYTTPEIASVGRCEADAGTVDSNGLSQKVGLFNVASLGKAAIEGAEQGFIKLVFGPDDALVGAQLMCPRATDMIGELATAVANRLTLPQLARVVRPHPTFNEGVTEAVEDALGHAIHKIYRASRPAGMV